MLARCVAVQPVTSKHVSKSATLMRRSGERDRALIRMSRFICWLRRLFRCDRPDEQAGRWNYFA
jgi:hypothetical protein